MIKTWLLMMDKRLYIITKSRQFLIFHSLRFLLRKVLLVVLAFSSRPRIDSLLPNIPAPPCLPSMSFQQDTISAPNDAFSILKEFFGKIDSSKSILKDTKGLLVVDPILRKRATIYIVIPVDAFRWHEFLTRASYSVEEVSCRSS